MVSIWRHVSEWQTTLGGSVISAHSTMAFSTEPTGVAFNPANGHWFFSDDDKHKIIEVNLGAAWWLNDSCGVRFLTSTG